MTEYKHLFGPVPSRRLGLSLGIDLTPGKTCSLDCIFCQVGRTRIKTLQAGEFVPTREVCDELKRWLEAGGQADHITLSGSGEPTLHTGFGEILDDAKSRTRIPTVLLSNGTLFFRPEVRRAATKAAIVKVTLSAWDEASFQRIHKPPAGLSFDQVYAGQAAFRGEFRGELWLEVFLMAGINTAPEQIARIAELAARIAPDKIHLNTAVRPTADTTVAAVARKQLEEWASLFQPAADVASEFKGHAGARAVGAASILALVRRHAVTAEQLAAALGADPRELPALLADLTKNGALRPEQRGGQVYYVEGAEAFAPNDEPGKSGQDVP